MFLNKAVFKRLLKESYNSNILRIGSANGGLVILGSHWKIWSREAVMPNWFKAVLIELIGEFPEEGTLLQYGKGEVPQQVFAQNLEFDIRTEYMAAKQPYTAVPLVAEYGCARIRFMQNNKTKEISLLSEELFSVVDFSNMEKDENRPAGPSADANNERFYWSNDACTLVIFGLRTHNKKLLELMDQLQEIDFENFWEE